MSSTGIEPLLDEGLRLCQAGAWSQAETLYRNLTASHPDVPDAWNMYALVLQQQGRLEEAARAAGRTVELRPGIPPYWLTRGNIDLERGRYEEARASFRRATRIEPSFAVAHYRLGLAYHRELQYAEAANAYREALRHAPDVAEIHAQLAETMVSLDKRVEAMQAYEQAYRRDPEGALDRRGGIECLERMDFEQLPDWWYAEIVRFFSRRDLEYRPYVKLALKALETRNAFRSALDRGMRFDMKADAAAFRELAADPLFLTLLRDCLLPNPRFERLLTRLRSLLLLDDAARAEAPPDFLCALALQCFVNEFVFFETDAERARIEALRPEVEAALQSDAALTPETLRAVVVLAAYRPLHTLRGAERLLSVRGGPALAELLERAVSDMAEERRLRGEIAAIGEVTDAVSQAVRAMYEEHPYPRWHFVDREPPMPLAEWFAHELPGQPPLDAAAEVRILVAGCGTGKDASWLAANIAGATVLGVDLSRASLAHGQRMARTLGLANVQFRHGDILGLGSIAERFDVVVSTGVLHHMRDPQAGMRVVTGLVRPGGLLKIGLYSATARHAVNAGRERIAREGLMPSEPDIRTLRQLVFDAPADSPLKELELSNDFYSMSMCRDLLFHIQEHQFTVPLIAETCKTHGLTFLGMSELPREALGRYRRMFPDDPAMVDLENWHAFEQSYPATFSSMYLFWARKD